MANPIDQEFFARLNVLNAKFAAGIPDTMTRLAEARARVQYSAPDQAQVKEMHQVLHTIAGSAATFGFRILGQEARHLEQRLRVMMAFPEVPASEWQEWLDELGQYIAWGLRDPKASAYP
jgi:HPt (histidine-containing phosphotransfer) domain-containing protein